MSPPLLDRRTLNRTLLERQGLLRRERRDVHGLLTHLVGMQSQVPNNPFTGLWSRIEGFDPAELDALMLERRAVRVSLMRTTIHLVTTEDALSLRPRMGPVLERAFGSQRAFREGVEGAPLDEVAAFGEGALRERPLTGKGLRAALAERFPDWDPAMLAQWIRYRVPMVQVTPRGLWGRSHQVTNAALETWAGRPLEEPMPMERLVERYLRAFGPATVGDTRTWSWLTGLREVFERMRPRLRTFRDEHGRELFDMEDAPIADGETPAQPRFLPEYDNVLLSHEERSRMGGPWYANTDLARGSLLVDGFVAGGWLLVADRRSATLEVDLFRDLAPDEQDAVEAEADALRRFLATGRDGEVTLRRVTPGDPTPLIGRR